MALDGKAPWEERLFEWLSLLGIPVAALGFLLTGFTASGWQWESALKAIGFGLFLGGVFATNRLLRKKIERLHQDLSDKVDRLVDQHRVVATYRDILDLALALGPDSAPVRAVSDALRDVLDDHVRPATESLKGFRERVPNARIQIRDLSPVFDLMHRLTQVLPPNSVWLGITHLSRASAWTGKESVDPSFAKYLETTRSRSKAGDLTVYRIFCIRPGEEEKKIRLSEVTREEAKHGISVRLLEDYPWPDDISVLYLPPPNLRTRPAKQHDLEDLQADGYQPLCALYYKLVDDVVVRRLEIFPGASDDFTAAAQSFRKTWRKASPIDSATGLPAS